MKKPAPNSKIKTVLFIAVTFLVIYAIILNISHNQNSINYSPKILQEEQSNKYKTFQSSNILKFTINIPKDFTAEENLGAVVLSSDKGKISIDKNGTNYDNLTEYIKNNKNNLASRIKNKKEITINNLEGLTGYIDEEKIYVIYRDNTVYFLSTKAEGLHADLDQIAQSFKYTP